MSSYNRRSASPIRVPSPGPGGRRPNSFTMEMGSSSGLPTVPSLPSFAPPGGYSNGVGGSGLGGGGGFGSGGGGLGSGGLGFYAPPQSYNNSYYNSTFYGGAPGSPLSSMGLQPYPGASQGLPPPPSFSPSFDQPMQLSRRDSFGSAAGAPGGRRGSVSGRSRMPTGDTTASGHSLPGIGGGLGGGFAGLGPADIPPYPSTGGPDAPLFGTGPIAPSTPTLGRPVGSGTPGPSRGTPVVSPTLPSAPNVGNSALASSQASTSAASQSTPASGSKAPGQRTTRQYRKKTPPEACAVCGTDTTPEWRKGPSGLRTLCNACGLTAAKQPTRDPQTIEEVWQQLTDIGINRYRGNFTLKQEAKDAAARSWYAAKESGQQPRVSNRSSYANRNRDSTGAPAGGSGRGQPQQGSSGRPNSVGRNPNDLEGAQALFSMSRGRNPSFSNGSDSARSPNANYSPSAGPPGGFASASPNPPTIPGPTGFANPPQRRNSLTGPGGGPPGRMSISSMLNTEPPPRPSSAASNRSTGSRSGLYR